MEQESQKVKRRGRKFPLLARDREEKLKKKAGIVPASSLPPCPFHHSGSFMGSADFQHQ
jgi:hypothetical protein